jgi:hypothetical protein
MSCCPSNADYFECMCVNRPEGGGKIDIDLLDDVKPSQWNSMYMDVLFGRVGEITLTYRRL